MKVLSVLLVTGFCVSALGQSSGGGSGNGGRDSNPWNPANWIVQTSREGSDTISSWDFVNGQPKNVVTVLSWDEGIETFGAHNYSGATQTSFMRSEGTYTFTIRWVGDGPGPPEVLVKVRSLAWGGTCPTGHIVLDNALGTPIDTRFDFEPYDCYKSQRPELLTEIPVSQGVGRLTLEKSALASATGGDEIRAYSTARGATCVVAERELTVSGAPSPTFVLGFHDAPVPQVQLDPRHLEMDIGLRYYLGIQEGHASAMLSGDLWGAWNMPLGNWSWSDYQETNPLRSHIDRNYTLQEVVALVMQGPTQLDNYCHVTDEDRITREGSASVRVHAPWEFPVITNTGEKHSEWVRVSDWIIRSPFGSSTLTQTVAWNWSVTKTVSLGVSGSTQVLVYDHPVVLGMNLGFQYGETAGVTLTNSYSFTIQQGPPDMRFCIRKRALWSEDTGFCLGYAPDGYSGLQDVLYVHWRSTTRELAEVADHEYEVYVEEIDP